jgi:hypothetical protein
MDFEDQEITAWKKYRGGLVLAGKIDLVVQMNRNGQNCIHGGLCFYLQDQWVDFNW